MGTPCFTSETKNRPRTLWAWQTIALSLIFINMKWLAMLLAAMIVASDVGWIAADSTTSSDHDRIQILLEYNRRLVRMTENYLKDRPRIPPDYQGVSDKEYLRRYRLERPLKIPPKDLVIVEPVDDEPVAAPKPHSPKKK